MMLQQIKKNKEGICFPIIYPGKIKIFKILSFYLYTPPPKKKKNKVAKERGSFFSLHLQKIKKTFSFFLFLKYQIFQQNVFLNLLKQ